MRYCTYKLIATVECIIANIRTFLPSANPSATRAAGQQVLFFLFLLYQPSLNFGKSYHMTPSAAMTQPVQGRNVAHRVSQIHWAFIPFSSKFGTADRLTGCFSLARPSDWLLLMESWQMVIA